jgi:cell division protein FtsL
MKERLLKQIKGWHGFNRMKIKRQLLSSSLINLKLKVRTITTFLFIFCIGEEKQILIAENEALHLKLQELSDDYSKLMSECKDFLSLKQLSG